MCHLTLHAPSSLATLTSSSSPNIFRYLYSLFTNPIINKNNIPFLIACNKTDLVTANSVEKITKEIEIELYVM
jgi:signal recognition particle receptor subunit beta